MGEGLYLSDKHLGSESYRAFLSGRGKGLFAPLTMLLSAPLFSPFGRRVTTNKIRRSSVGKCIISGETPLALGSTTIFLTIYDGSRNALEKRVKEVLQP